jgi:hypothetical protein
VYGDVAEKQVVVGQDLVVPKEVIPGKYLLLVF